MATHILSSTSALERFLRRGGRVAVHRLNGDVYRLSHHNDTSSYDSDDSRVPSLRSLPSYGDVTESMQNSSETVHSPSTVLSTGEWRRFFPTESSCSTASSIGSLLRLATVPDVSDSFSSSYCRCDTLFDASFNTDSTPMSSVIEEYSSPVRANKTVVLDEDSDNDEEKEMDAKVAEMIRKITYADILDDDSEDDEIFGASKKEKKNNKKSSMENTETLEDTIRAIDAKIDEFRRKKADRRYSSGSSEL